MAEITAESGSREFVRCGPQSIGAKAQKELDEAISSAAKYGWRIASSSAVIKGSVVAHYFYFEHERPSP